MIVASLLLILVAVVLLVLGLAGGSSIMLIISIAASLLAAVALVVGARQAAANRVMAEPGRTGRRSPGAPRTANQAGPGVAYGPPLVEPEVPIQHMPTTVPVVERPVQGRRLAVGCLHVGVVAAA
ncbi:hypothetical protein ACWD50_30505, partial [Micromonospora sp. NPDC005113]